VALTPGARIGSYEITAQIGVGGMGEVYRATDTNLGRAVAIKVLPDAVADDAERLSRFDREARTLATLNHPNIAQIYGLERSGGQTALVMELVEGPTLADRIAQGPVPVDEALPIARQIAEALEAAHEQGIIHRDLKPANVKVRPDGAVKVLDFGLAKALEPAFAQGATARQAPSMSPTITTPAMTQAGMILGTAAYMSPEQARGQPVDRRADIWAFACVLFEMLAGGRAFDGADTGETLAAVIRAEPEWSRLPGRLPAEIGDLLRRCLRKDARRRLRDIGDARIALSELAEAPASADAEATASRRGVPAAVPWTLVAVLVLVLAAVLWRNPAGESPASTGRTARFEFELPGSPTSGNAIALSADGRRFAYVGGGEAGREVLFLRSLDDPVVREVAGTEGANFPFFSPDGEWLAFLAGGELRRVPVAGGRAELIAKAQEAWGSSWSSTGDIVFGSIGDGLYKVSATGGVPVRLTDPEGATHLWPRVLPDGDTVLFTIWTSGAEEAQVGVASLSDGTWHPLVPGTSPRYSPTGHLLFVRGETLMAAPFDLGTVRLTGEAKPMVERISTNIRGWADYDVSDDGLLVYLTADNSANGSKLVWVDRRGAVEPVIEHQEGGFLQPVFSPDGTLLAAGFFPRGVTGTLVSTYQIASDRRVPIVLDSTFEIAVWPVWSPDGRWVALATSRGGGFDIFRVAANGSGETEQVTFDPTVRQLPTSWSVDDVLAIEQGPIGARDILVRSMSDGGEFEPLLVTDSNDRGGRFSPDGGWLAFTSDRSGRDEVWVLAFPPAAGDAPVPVSTSGGKEPVWSRDGRELFYRNGDQMMSVPIETAPTFRPGRAEVLFEGDFSYGYLDWSSNYDVAPDGSRFVMIEDGPVSKLQVVVGWFEELRSLVRAGRP